MTKKKAIDMPNTQWYIARSACHWGVGDSPEQAKRHMKKQGRCPEYSVHKLPMGIESYDISDHGTVNWKYADPDDPRTGQSIKLELVELKKKG